MRRTIKLWHQRKVESSSMASTSRASQANTSTVHRVYTQSQTDIEDKSPNSNQRSNLGRHDGSEFQHPESVFSRPLQKVLPYECKI